MEMQRSNPFDLLKDVDQDDPSQFIAAAKQPQKIPPAKGSQAKLPSKPLPPQQAAKEARNSEAQRAQTSQGRFQRGGAYGLNREFKANGHAQMEGARVGEASRGSSRYINGDMKDASVRGPRRMYDRYSSTKSRPDAKGHESGAHISEKRSKEENAVNLEKKENRPADEGKADKDPQREQEEEEPEDKEMTLEEYEKIKEEKRKALISTKTEGRKVEMDKDFKSMKQLSVKKEIDEVFIQLGSNKDAAKKKEMERQEKARKSLNINEFLRPVEGQNYRSRRRDDAHGNGSAEGGHTRGHFTDRSVRSGAGPLINDPSHFPTLAVN